MEAVVIAAGEGRRLRPLTERWPKPVLPIDGKPVIATLLRELEQAKLAAVTVVVGHLGDQIRRLLDGLDVRFAEQPEPLGSADAVLRAVKAGAGAPFVVSAADTVYSPGDVARFVSEWGRSGAAGAMAAPLWGVGPELLAHLEGLPGPPFELLEAFRRAGSDVTSLELGPLRQLTRPADVVIHNFVYLESNTDE
ncbi:MAG TPA: NTP transferase domain-containing protein [Gaiellaceae bacterium]|nr:NTP transferase domain-containing protein [Gaiellaceae bacterium]